MKRSPLTQAQVNEILGLIDKKDLDLHLLSTDTDIIEVNAGHHQVMIDLTTIPRYDYIFWKNRAGEQCYWPIDQEVVL